MFRFYQHDIHLIIDSLTKLGCLKKIEFDIECVMSFVEQYFGRNHMRDFEFVDI